MQMHSCHFHGHGPHGHRPKNFRKPERWNSGWSRGVGCQPHGRCRKEQEGVWSAPRDGNHPWCHHHPVQHGPSNETQKHHFSHFMKRFQHFHHGRKNFHHHHHNHHGHSHHHGHSFHHGHSHHQCHCCQGEGPSKPCPCMPETSRATCCNGHQNKNNVAGPSTNEAQKNTRSIGTETEEIEPSE